MQTHPPLQRRRTRRRRPDQDLLTVAAAAVAAVVLVVPISRGPQTVDRLVVDNPTPWDLHVRVGDGRGGWLPLPVAPAGTREAVQSVVDRGRTWVVEFSVGGERSSPVRLTRSDLAGDDWTIRVPDEVVAAFSAAGVPPTPD